MLVINIEPFGVIVEGVYAILSTNVCAWMIVNGF